MANALVSYAAYLGQSFYPVDLAPFYPHLGTRLPMASVAGALVLLVAISAVAAYAWRRRPYLPVGWLWFLGMLVPVIGLVGSFVHGRADRYTYLSQIGLSIALAWGVWSVYRSQQSRQAASWRRWMLAAVSGGVVLVLAMVAWRQTSYWRNTETRLDACGFLHGAKRDGSLLSRQRLHPAGKNRGSNRPNPGGFGNRFRRSVCDRTVPCSVRRVFDGSKAKSTRP